MYSFENCWDFVPRHLPWTANEIAEMLQTCGASSLDALIDETIPKKVRLRKPLNLPARKGEPLALLDFAEILKKNENFTSLIGQGYYGTIMPEVLARNVYENPGWYAQHAPYQAEVSQGRLSVLAVFQAMVADLTALPCASLLDEGTAASEAMALCDRLANGQKRAFFAADTLHPQTLEVLKTRAQGYGIALTIAPIEELEEVSNLSEISGVFVQYPDTYGRIADFAPIAEKLHQMGAKLVVACDLLALVQLRAPGEFGADIAIGSAQRFGTPMGFGGPHAAFMAVRDELKHQMPGRIIARSIDKNGRPAYQLALQNRDQNIRCEKATSAQALMAILNALYAMYHGLDGLKAIAARVHGYTDILRRGLTRLGYPVGKPMFFDTLTFELDDETLGEIAARAKEQRINFRIGGGKISISMDETCDFALLDRIFEIFAFGSEVPFSAESIVRETHMEADLVFRRTSDFLTAPIFNKIHGEHDMVRFLHHMQEQDISLTRSMMPLGSCTMKLNGTASMRPISWPTWVNVHPFAPKDQWKGHAEILENLKSWIAEITGMKGVSLQPNAGAQGELSGLDVIAAWHRAQNNADRKICLIPVSAHGTNSASAAMAGFEVQSVVCNANGDVDLDDLRLKAEKAGNRLGALMITYPSTQGAFEEGILEICEIIHENGGLVYFDGANMNAEIGLCRPGDIGADVCYLDLHKLFGCPGAGPICVCEKLVPFLPGGENLGAVTSAPFGSAGILPIAAIYISLLGPDGLTKASKHAILAANYMAARLKDAYPIYYTGKNGRVAHEFILDCNSFKDSAGIDVDDIAKRLADFGFHAPTMSFSIHGTLMIEPTESEPKAELDRFCDALLAIREEIRQIETGAMDRADNPLKNAPHTAEEIAAETWTHPYSRAQAAWPAEFVRQWKYWPPVARIDTAYGDRNLCFLPPEL